MEELRPGQRIGAYRILRQLGVGGMGRVYEAEHVALGVRRALKVFSTESEHSEFLRKRFVAEGRILADLRHPRIVRVYDLVVDDDSGLAYFEMDLVLSPNGQPRTLADEQRDGVSEEKIVGWFKDICEGLAYIHSQGVVHRDISLDNILIGSDGHAVITDFGVAKIIDDSYRRKIDVTVTVEFKDGSELRMGKGLYMAPELKKKGGKATFASDAYAVGVILFRLLSGLWYDVGTHLDDWLADFEYDWHPVISRLCSVNPKERLGEGGIAALVGLLKRKVRPVPFWRRKWAILCGTCLTFFVDSAIVATWLVVNSDNPNSVPKEKLRPTAEILKGAERGVTEDMVLAAEMYRDGKGVETNYARSVELYRRAIADGSFDAVGGIGTMYEHGWGVTNNPHTAYLMYLVAAANGVNNSLPNVIRCYEEGIGVGKNPSEAKRWTKMKIMKPLEKKANEELAKKERVVIQRKWFKHSEDYKKMLTSRNLTQIGTLTYRYGVRENRSICIYQCGKQGEFQYKIVSPHKGRLVHLDTDCVSGNLTLPNTIEAMPVEAVGIFAFNNATNLVSVTLPTSIKSINMAAFSGCEKLTRISLPEGLLEIGDAAFFGCKNLHGVDLPHSVTNIGPLAFYPMPPTVPEDHPYFTLKDDALYSKDMSTLFAYYGTNKTFAIDGRTEKIGDYAFFRSHTLTSVRLPNGLREIGKYALMECSGLKNLRIPSSVVRIADGAFQCCYDLEIFEYDGCKPAVGEDIYEDYIAVVSLVKRGMGWEDEYGMLPTSWPEKWDEVSMASDKRERSKTCFPVRYWKGDENFSDKELTELYISSLKSQAEAGNVTAMSILGARYRGGWGGVNKDEEKALQYLQGSALGGNVEDMGKIGCLYRNGIKGIRNYAAAAKWFNRAISEGGRWSCWVCQEFAPMYRDGHGVEKNQEIAFLLWLIAASHGMAWAQCEVAGCYERGIGVEKNIAEAKRWYNRALTWKKYEGRSQYEWRLKGAVQHAERKLRELR